MVTVRRADFLADYAELRRIRFAVFVDEQGVPEALELDDRDPHCVHVLAFRGGEAVGTGRIDLEAGGKVGRVAVLAGHRRGGVGAALMEALHDVAREAGLRAVWCHAQTTAVPFYRSLRYRVTGKPFTEAGIEHRKMHRVL